MSDQDFRSIQDFIRTEVDRHWQETRTPLLLTTIGIAVRRAHPQAAVAMKEGLKRFLEQWPVVQLIEEPNVPGKIGAIPLGLTPPKDTSEIFKSSAKPAHPGISLEPTFWRAFHTPLQGRRFVIVSPDRRRFIKVVDSDNGGLPDTNALEILPSDVAPASNEPLADKVSETWRRITNWVERNSLSLSVFRKVSEKEGPGLESRYATSHEIAEALTRLDPQEQARIFVPLDLVAKMIARR